jgi:hypothetical protein
MTLNARATPSVSISRDDSGFEHPCRPDASSGGGCTLGTYSDYGGGNSTEPNLKVGAMRFAYGGNAP